MRTELVISFYAGQIKGATAAPIDCVLDLNSFGDVVGVEILNLAHLTQCRLDESEGKASLGSREDVRWSYDTEADAFYITLREERSLDQLCSECTIEGDDKGNIARIIVVAENDSP
jgi:uncharacterized protein YuzE